MRWPLGGRAVELEANYNGWECGSECDGEDVRQLRPFKWAFENIKFRQIIAMSGCGFAKERRNWLVVVWQINGRIYLMIRPSQGAELGWEPTDNKVVIVVIPTFSELRKKGRDWLTVEMVCISVPLWLLSKNKNMSCISGEISSVTFNTTAMQFNNTLVESSFNSRGKLTTKWWSFWVKKKSIQYESL